MAHRLGAQSVLWVGAVGIAPLPLLWLVSDAVGYLVALQLVAGVVWGAFELATLLAMFDHLEPRTRISVLTYYNLSSALVVVLGSLIGTALFRSVSPPASAYLAVFVASSACRLAPLLVLRGARRVRAGADLPEAMRTLAVRPNAGALQRPVLAGVEEEEGAGAPPEA
jgi:hypothetical protein